MCYLAGSNQEIEHIVMDPSEDTFSPNSKDSGRISMTVRVNIGLKVLFFNLRAIVQNLHQVVMTCSNFIP